MNNNREKVILHPHSQKRKMSFEKEKQFLSSYLKEVGVGKIKHIGSTAITGIEAKPIIDMLMEVPSQNIAGSKIAGRLIERGYEHILHHALTSDEPPVSSRFIKRDGNGKRTHHIRCAEAGTAIRRRVYFVRYLNENKHIAQEYGNLKKSLAKRYPDDRRAYTIGKGEFIRRITDEALRKL